MRPSNRDRRGNILIWLGSFFLLLILLDSIRPLGFTDWPDRLWKRASVASRNGKDASGGVPASPRRTPVIPGARITVPCSGEALTASVVRPGVSYNLWAWSVKPEFKTGDAVNVRAAHPAAGGKGGFAIVAFADSNDDGKPDREIARSKYLAAGRAGTWSGFTFKTAEKRIFVGITWPIGDGHLIYRQNGPWPLEESPLEHIFYFRKEDGVFHTAGPAYTNMRISFSD
jgi:hypothetical protein